jgi:malate dehydrogenase (oxaloacetate-decarboxylating)(NADP+)
MLVSEASVVTDEMFTAAANTLAESVSQADLDAGSLYPPLTELRRISSRIAEAVVRVASDSGVGKKLSESEIPAAVKRMVWMPQYPRLNPV